MTMQTQCARIELKTIDPKAVKLTMQTHCTRMELETHRSKSCEGGEGEGFGNIVQEIRMELAGGHRSKGREGGEGFGNFKYLTPDDILPHDGPRNTQ